MAKPRIRIEASLGDWSVIPVITWDIVSVSWDDGTVTFDTGGGSTSTIGGWVDITEDVISAVGLRLRYGVNGHGPLDRTAGPGELQFALRNDAGNSGGLQGYYSPLHANARLGWSFGVPIRVSMVGTDTVRSVSSITRAGDTATVTTSTSHGLSTDQWVLIEGASPTNYNGVYRVTVTGGTTFTYDVMGEPSTPASGTITAVRTYVKFVGRVHTITPTPGQYRNQPVYVTAYDVMRDLLEADIREISVAVNETEDALIESVIDVLPVAIQPDRLDLDAGADSYPYAFDDLGRGTKAAGVLQDLTLSAYGFLATTGDGTLIYRSRGSLATGDSAFHFDETMNGLVVPTSLDGVFNRVRVTIRPRRIDAAATTVLWSQTGTPQAISAGSTVDIWGNYFDPTDPTRSIGGTDTVPPVSGTDFTANSQADGSGTDLTANIAVTASRFASTVKFEVTNTGATSAYLTSLQLRGRGLYRDAPETFESASEQVWERPLSFEMPYQDDRLVAQNAAESLQLQWGNLRTQIQQLEFSANASDALLQQALLREPGDRVTITETVTGLNTLDALIHAVELEATNGSILTCRWQLGAVTPFEVWQLGIAGAGELGETTVLGF